MKEICFLFSFFQLFLLNVWSVLHISTACDYFSLSWMSPLSVNVVFFRWTSAMHFYKQLKLVLFKFLSVLCFSFIFFLNLVIGWMYLILFRFWKMYPLELFDTCLFSVIHAVYVSQNSIRSIITCGRSNHKALPWCRETRVLRMWIISLPSCRIVDKAVQPYSHHSFTCAVSVAYIERCVRTMAPQSSVPPRGTYVCILSTLELYHA